MLALNRGWIGTRNTVTKPFESPEVGKWRSDVIDLNRNFSRGRSVHRCTLCTVTFVRRAPEFASTTVKWSVSLCCGIKKADATNISMAAPTARIMDLRLGMRPPKAGDSTILWQQHPAQQGSPLTLILSPTPWGEETKPNERVTQARH